MENHHFYLVNPLEIVIFHSYVCLPEGIAFPFPYQEGNQAENQKLESPWSHISEVAGRFGLVGVLITLSER